MSFEKLGLRPEILTGIKFKGYVDPTPIQEQAIPVILEGKDILAGAQTGTGKTAAFTLPLLHILSSNGQHPGHLPRALVLTPTRELAAQVGESVDDYGKGLNLRSTIVFGGVNINPQKKSIRKGTDIVTGTPGRLLDLAGQKVLDLSHIEVLILDEADRMLDMGFINDIKKIINLLPKKRQTLFFSATYSQAIKKLADTLLKKPELIEVARENTAAETVEQSLYRVAKARKRELLSLLIKQGDWKQVLVFTRTKHGANRLAKQLNSDGITSEAIHGNKSQTARTRALAQFKAGEARVLVATDIAARGLDIDRLPHVINYELPQTAEDYVHRIGRTGRAGCSGEAISLVMNEEREMLRSIEKLIKRQIPVKLMDSFPAQPESDEPEANPRNRSNQRGQGGNRNNNRNKTGGKAQGNQRTKRSSNEQKDRRNDDSSKTEKPQRRRNNKDSSERSEKPRQRYNSRKKANPQSEQKKAETPSSSSAKAKSGGWRKKVSSLLKRS